MRKTATIHWGAKRIPGLARKDFLIRQDSRDEPSFGARMHLRIRLPRAKNPPPNRFAPN
jgi:hypothetical protein